MKKHNTKLMMAFLMATPLFFGCQKIEETVNSQVSNHAFQGCSDPATIDVLKDIFNQQYAQTLKMATEYGPTIEKAYEGAEISIHGIRTTAISKDVGKYECIGTMKTKLPNEALKIFQSDTIRVFFRKSDLAYVADGVETMINYSTQMTDDKKNVYVEISAPFELGKLMVEMAATYLSLDGKFSFMGDAKIAPEDPKTESQ